jgi:hypothetical protein
MTNVVFLLDLHEARKLVKRMQMFYPPAFQIEELLTQSPVGLMQQSQQSEVLKVLIWNDSALLRVKKNEDSMEDSKITAFHPSEHLIEASGSVKSFYSLSGHHLPNLSVEAMERSMMERM